ALHPRVYYLNSDPVRAGSEGCRDVDAIRLVPRLPEVLAIDRHLGKVLHVTEVEPQTSALSEPLGRGLHRLRVGSDTGEILHARVSVLTPVGKFVHGDRCWSSPARLKSNVPRPVDCGHFDVH